MVDGGPVREIRFTVSRSAGAVSALVMRPPDARAMLVIGHGAGAGMRHAFMEAVARRLCNRGLATLRYQFPYMDKGSRRPDPHPILFATVRAAVATARAEACVASCSWASRCTRRAGRRRIAPRTCRMCLFRCSFSTAHATSLRRWSCSNRFVTTLVR